MADIKISQLGAAATISDSDVFPMTANGITVKAAASLIKEYAIGDDDISALGDGSPTGAILALNANKSAKSDIAMIEASVAIAPHAIGAEFYLSGVLMRATAPIEIGDQIVNGTNCAPADDVSSQIQALTNNKQPKSLDSPVTIGGSSRTTVEAAIGAAANQLSKSIIANNEVSFGNASGTIYDFMELCISLGLIQRNVVCAFQLKHIYSWQNNFTFTEPSGLETMRNYIEFCGKYGSNAADNTVNGFNLRITTYDGHIYNYSEDRPGYGGPHEWHKLV